MISLLLSGCSGFRDIEKRIARTAIGTPREVESISEDMLAYQTLDAEDKKAYDMILDCINSQEEKVSLAIFDPDECDKVFEAVNADYGGLFWVSGYSYSTYGNKDETIGFVFKPRYTMTREERDGIQAEIDDVVSDWLLDLPANADDYTKSKYVYSTIINNVDYDKKNEDNQNIISVFLDRRTVCQGYSSATAYILQYLGIPAMTVTGEADGIPHAWNLVKLDGEYYYIDTTWGNSLYQNSDGISGKQIDYAYLNITSEEINRTHEANSEIFLPKCVTIEDNYYVREGLYFRDWDESGIGVALSNSYYDDLDIATVKLGSKELYEKTIRRFIDEGALVNYCEGLSSISYIGSEDTYVLTIQFKKKEGK